MTVKTTKKMTILKPMSQWINYQLYLFKIWTRELVYSIKGIDRDFRCQSYYEMNPKCKIQCDHCKAYYSGIEE